MTTPMPLWREFAELSQSAINGRSHKLSQGHSSGGFAPDNGPSRFRGACRLVGK
ncbi:hypothetical protein OKW30_005975 [Paraburkholderia sp. Clong3]